MSADKKASLTITVPEKVYSTIDAQGLAKMLEANEDMAIVDVRDEDFVGGSSLFFYIIIIMFLFVVL